MVGRGRDGVPGGKGPSLLLPTGGCPRCPRDPPSPGHSRLVAKEGSLSERSPRPVSNPGLHYTEVGKSFPKASSFHVTAESGWKASGRASSASSPRCRCSAPPPACGRRAAHALSWSACRRARCSSCTCRRLGRTWSNVQCVQRLCPGVVLSMHVLAVLHDRHVRRGLGRVYLR